MLKVLYGPAGAGATGPTGPTNYVQISGNLIPDPNQTWNLGSTGARWASIYVGQSSVNVGAATVSADDSGIAYTENGFATPFINVGPVIDVTGAVG